MGKIKVFVKESLMQNRVPTVIPLGRFLTAGAALPQNQLSQYNRNSLKNQGVLSFNNQQESVYL